MEKEKHHKDCRGSEECFVTPKECREMEIPPLSEGALEEVKDLEEKSI